MFLNLAEVRVKSDIYEGQHQVKSKVTLETLKWTEKIRKKKTNKKTLGPKLQSKSSLKFTEGEPKSPVSDGESTTQDLLSGRTLFC